MNQREQQFHRNDISSKFKMGTPLNAVRLNANNTYDHELAKFNICLSLARAGREFMTEAEFKMGRADVVDVTSGEIIEVLKSESEDNLQLKARVYPLPIRYVHAEMVHKPLKLEQLEALPFLEVKG